MLQRIAAALGKKISIEFHNVSRAGRKQVIRDDLPTLTRGRKEQTKMDV
jgi:hypothetical protein